MFRTRDFVLIAIVVVFLTILIAFTYSGKQLNSNTVSSVHSESPSEISGVAVSVDTPESSDLSREERLEKLRRKIQESDLVSLSAPAEDLQSEEALVIASSSEEQLLNPLLCSDYSALTMVFWPVSDIEAELVEGARLYFIESKPASTSSSSSSRERSVLLTLPVQFLPFGDVSCLSNDVIGIATDNSLIRNIEVSLYGVFGDGTLIGYALDGFPIYVGGSDEVDQCGGRIELGQYRYELTKDRSTILNCYAGSPQSIGL